MRSTQIASCWHEFFAANENLNAHDITILQAVRKYFRQQNG